MGSIVLTVREQGAEVTVEKLLGDLKNREFAYDDVLVAQGRKTTFFEKDIDLTTKVSRNITLKIPIMSAAMDTVCEHEMAIALALPGGIGVIHYNFGQNLDENIAKQLAEVKKVKRYENGFVENPITVSPADTIDKVAQIRREQASAVYHCTEAIRQMAKEYRIPSSADGGIERSGDITIAIALGANTVTLGSLLAGTNEAPGEYELRKGVRVKKYRGMGSLEAMAHGGAHRYNLEGAQIRVPEGGVRFLQSKGSAYQWIQTLVQGLKQGMFKAGCRTIEEMHEYAQLLPADKRSKREKHKFEE